MCYDENKYCEINSINIIRLLESVIMCNNEEILLTHKYIFIPSVTC